MCFGFRRERSGFCVQSLMAAHCISFMCWLIGVFAGVERCFFCCSGGGAGGIRKLIDFVLNHVFIKSCY